MEEAQQVLDSTVLDQVATQEHGDPVRSRRSAVPAVLYRRAGGPRQPETACDYTGRETGIAWDDEAAKAALVDALVLDA